MLRSKPSLKQVDPLKRSAVEEEPLPTGELNHIQDEKEDERPNKKAKVDETEERKLNG